MKTAVLLAFLMFSVSGAYADIPSTQYVKDTKDAAVQEATNKVYGKIPTSENGDTTTHALIWVE